MPSLFQGRIVYSLDPIPDPQGGNSKINRPFVVVSSTNEIRAGGKVRIVAITGSIGGYEDEVDISHGIGCRTGLSKPSVALGRWNLWVEQNRLRVSDNFVSPVENLKILTALRKIDADASNTP